MTALKPVLAVASLGLATLLAPPAHAGCMGFGAPGQGEDWHYSLGVSGAYVHHGGHAGSVNLDLTASYSLFSVTFNGKYLQEGPRSVFGAQLELSVYLLVSLGAGVGILFGDESGPIVHGFVGIPIPLAGEKLSEKLPVLPYLEPYYRVGAVLHQGWEPLHEVGLFAKVAIL
ncbi:MAG: hypothetical protein QM765_45815 [Myxococcales bacterium]